MYVLTFALCKLRSAPLNFKPSLVLFVFHLGFVRAENTFYLFCCNF